MHEHKSARQQFVPRECRIGTASGDQEPVPLIDLSEVHRRRLLALLQKSPTRRDRRLRHIDLTCRQQLRHRLPRRQGRIDRLKPLLLEKSARDGADEWAVECRMP